MATYDYSIINKLLEDDIITEKYETYIIDIYSNNTKTFTLIEYITTKHIIQDIIIPNNYIFTITILNIYNNIDNNIIEYYYDNKNNITSHYFFINSIILFLADLLYNGRKTTDEVRKKYKDSKQVYDYLLKFFFNKINIGYINILLLLLNLVLINDNELLNIYIKFIFNNKKYDKFVSFFKDKSSKKFIINYEEKNINFNNINDIDNFNMYNILNLNLLYSYNNNNKDLLLLNTNDKDEFKLILLNKFKFIQPNIDDIYIIIFHFIYHYLHLEDSTDP